MNQNNYGSYKLIIYCKCSVFIGTVLKGGLCDTRILFTKNVHYNNKIRFNKRITILQFVWNLLSVRIWIRYKLVSLFVHSKICCNSIELTGFSMTWGMKTTANMTYLYFTNYIVYFNPVTPGVYNEIINT